ncbi:MAG: hypothetical protein M3Y56_03380 [Armatimonadota bacterium]|nr:hypothetical protein [Armatimonadota bacterium]
MLETNGHRSIGLVLVDHGSKKQAANDMLLEVAELFRRVSGYQIVEPAHMELADPTIEAAFGACVEQGAKLVIVHPYFLSPGRHSTADIPRMVASAARKHPGVEYHVTPPLGIDEKIARLIGERIDHCIQSGFVCDYCREAGGCGTVAAERELVGAAA